MIRLRKILVLAVALGFAGPAAAQPEQPPEAAKSITGAWEISNADRDKICVVNLRSEPAPGGQKLEFDKACGDVFALTKSVTAWTLRNDKLGLLDAKGKPVLELDEVEKGMFEGERSGEGLYFMQAVAGAPPTRTAEEVAGDWAVMRGAGTKICVLSLAMSPVPNGLALKMKPGCDPLVSKFNPTAWRMERGELVVASARATWRFEEGDQVTWRRIPETADSIWLARE